MLFLFLFLFSLFEISKSVCSTNDISMEVIFVLDSTTADVDATEFQSQITFANTIISTFMASTSVGMIKLSDTISSTISKTNGNPSNLGASLSYNGGILSRNVVTTLSGIIQYGFTSGFDKQKYLIIFTYGESDTSDFCNLKIKLKEQNIEVIIIGNGNAFTPDFVSNPSNGYAKMQYLCLTSNPQDTAPGANPAFILRQIPSTTDAAITTYLSSSYFCPASTKRSFKITEIRPFGTNKFIEIINLGRTFSTNDVSITSNFLTAYTADLTSNVNQGDVFIISDNALSQCSTTCTQFSGSYINDNIGGSFINRQTGWNIKVTIGSSSNSIEIIHKSGSANDFEWWIAADEYTYVLYAVGANDQFPSNWIQSYTNGGNPGGYQDTGNRYIYQSNEQDAAITACRASVSRSLGTNDGGGFELSTQTCICGTISSNSIGLMASPYDPLVCKKIPSFKPLSTFDNDFGCRIYPTGSGSNELFKIAYSSANTDLPFQMKLNYINGFGTTINQQIRGSTTQILPSSKSTQNGFATNGVSYTTSGATIQIESWPCTKSFFDFTTTVSCGGTTDLATNLGSTINCLYRTMNPTKAPSKTPSQTPTGKPSGAPTRRPTNGVPILYCNQVACDIPRCGCTGPCDPDVYKPRTKNRPVSTNIDDVKAYSIEVIDELGLTGDFTDEVCFQWNMTFIGICQLGKFNQTDYTCRDSITNINELAVKMTPPIDINDTSIVNFTFTPDIIITPTGEEVCISGDNRIGSAIFKEFKPDILNNDNAPFKSKLVGQYQSVWHFKINTCYQKLGGDCILRYPNEYYFFYDIGKRPGITTRTTFEIPTWVWWIVIPLLLFLCIVAILVARNWWQKKKTEKIRDEKNAELNEIIQDNVLGFGHKLDTANIYTNPMAKANPAMVGPASTAKVDPNIGKNKRIEDVARVKGEKFEIRQEYGQSKQAQRVTSMDYD